MKKIKKCAMCGEEKSNSKFFKNKDICIKCHNELKTENEGITEEEKLELIRKMQQLAKTVIENKNKNNEK